MIRLLHRYGADIKQTNNLGLSPMHFAAKADRAFALTFLYKNGADPDSVDNEYLTPLHWACYMASEEAIYFLLAWSKAINQ